MKFLIFFKLKVTTNKFKLKLRAFKTALTRKIYTLNTASENTQKDKHVQNSMT